MDEHFTTKVLEDKLHCVVLIRGRQADGERHYCYLAVRLDHMDMLAKVQRRGEPFEPTDYGQVLLHNTGEPTPDVMQKMESEFNFDHSGYVDLLND